MILMDIIVVPDVPLEVYCSAIYEKELFQISKAS